MRGERTAWSALGRVAAAHLATCGVGYGLLSGSVARAQAGTEPAREEPSPPAAPAAPPTTSFPDARSNEEQPQDSAGATVPSTTTPSLGAGPAAPQDSAEAAAPSEAPPPRVTAELLALCTSTEPTARNYCLTQLEQAPELPPAARDPLGYLATRDSNLSPRARALYTRAFGTDPGPLSAEPTEPLPDGSEHRAEGLPPGDPMRVIYAPTALTRPARRFGFNAFELGILTFDYGLTENVEIGAQTTIPIGFITIGGLLKVGYAWDGGAIAVRGNALMLKLLDANEERPVVLYGAGPVLTLGNYDRYLNLGAQFYGARIEDDSVGLALPNIGASIRVARVLRLGAELYVPTGLDGDVDDLELGDFVLILWGIRLFGDHVWGDIALADPICQGCAEIYRVIPLGIPFLNIGGSW